VTHFDVHRGGLTPGTACPSALDLARFVEGTVPPDTRALLVSHLDECDDCREVVATVVSTLDIDAAPGPVLLAPAPWSPGGLTRRWGHSLPPWLIRLSTHWTARIGWWTSRPRTPNSPR
jgi:Putative zinc-finger